MSIIQRNPVERSDENTVRYMALLKEIKSVSQYDWVRLSGVQYIYLFVSVDARRFKIGITGNVAERLKQISRPYEKYGKKWDCLGVLVVNELDGYNIEQYFHKMFRLLYKGMLSQEPYRSNEIYELETSVDFVARMFFSLSRNIIPNIKEQKSIFDEQAIELFTKGAQDENAT